MVWIHLSLHWCGLSPGCLTTLDNYEGFGPLLQPQMAPAPQVAQGRSVGCGVWDFERAHGEIGSSIVDFISAHFMPLLGHFPPTSGCFTSTYPEFSSRESLPWADVYLAPQGDKEKEKEKNIHSYFTKPNLTALSWVTPTVTFVHDLHVQVIHEMASKVVNHPGSRDIWESGMQDLYQVWEG